MIMEQRFQRRTSTPGTKLVHKSTSAKLPEALRHQVKRSDGKPAVLHVKGCRERRHGDGADGGDEAKLLGVPRSTPHYLAAEPGKHQHRENEIELLLHAQGPQVQKNVCIV